MVLMHVINWMIKDWITIWTVILVAILVITFSHHLWILSRLPPGPWGVPVLGYSRFIDPKKPYKTFDELSKKYGKIICFSLGSIRIVALADAKLIRSAFSKEIYAGRPPLPVTHGIMKGYGILGSEGQWWSEQRRFLIDSFRELGIQKHSVNRIKMEDKIMKDIKFCVTQFSLNADGIPFECHSILSHVFGNMIAQLIFGRRFDIGDKVFERQLHLIDCGFKMVSIMGAMNFFPMLTVLPRFRKAYKELLAFKDEHHQFLREEINKHLEVLDENEPKDYLDLFLIKMKEKEDQLNTSFVDPQLIHALADIFGAGIETSKVTFHWLLLYVMIHKNVQSNLVQELHKVVGRDRLPTYTDLPNMPYTEAVITETQRLANLVPIGAPHGTTEDSELDGYLIPQGTMIMALLWTVHMNPESWDEPEKFNPSRFINSEGKFVKPDCLLPFSAGRRMCPGDELAKMEIFLLLTNILHRFTIVPPDDNDMPNLEPQMGFTLTPLPYKLRLLPRPL